MANNFNPYMNNSYGYPVMQELQSMKDRIDRTMQNYQQTQNQFMNPNQQPAQIQQTFQLSNPQSNTNDFDGKYADNIEEVKNTLVYKNTLFINKDMSVLWHKAANGEIKTYTLIEVIQKDEKDKKIENLEKQIEDMKFMLAQQNQSTELEEKVEKKTKK